jgi:rhamnogalacturonyl hydrolase YesR
MDKAQICERGQQFAYCRANNGGRTMTAKHTPGEWKLVEFLKDRKGMFHKVHDEQGVTIANIPCNPTDPEEWHRANARLIAAAPKLLEMLESILEIIDYEGEINNSANRVIDDTRIIIRKAKGE